MNKKLTKEELLETVKTFRFNKENGFKEYSYGTREDLGTEEFKTLLRSDTDIYEVAYNFYKAGYLRAMKRI